MRYRARGILVVLSGVFFVAGLLDPPILPAWGGSATDVMAAAPAHRAAWFASTWLITLSIPAGPAAAELLAGTLEIPAPTVLPPATWGAPASLWISVTSPRRRRNPPRQFAGATTGSRQRTPSRHAGLFAGAGPETMRGTPVSI
jgi:hypothetical protein